MRNEREILDDATLNRRRRECVVVQAKIRNLTTCLMNLEDKKFRRQRKSEHIDWTSLVRSTREKIGALLARRRELERLIYQFDDDGKIVETT